MKDTKCIDPLAADRAQYPGASDVTSYVTFRQEDILFTGALYIQYALTSPNFAAIVLAIESADNGIGSIGQTMAAFLFLGSEGHRYTPQTIRVPECRTSCHYQL